ncbi:MAG: HYExAFE family protein [Planctomycetota bacterium]
MQRRHHYEQAFEHHLRAHRIPYVSVNEARKALMPSDARLRAICADTSVVSLKSFDFVIYPDAEGDNLIVDVKGRKLGNRASRHGVQRLENWVTQDDVRSLGAWESLFGPGFRATFAFLYLCEQQPPDGLFSEILEHRGRWYALVMASLEQYAAAMRPRSVRWRTMHLDGAAFDQIAQRLVGTG